ncbi:MULTISPECIES: hypothetical protein [Mycolicibacterium]|jgi:hypothetical protein|uniref:Integral membrane protein n=1 Tax=Mycolicibacterium vanbaalenii (strain DSM 7251 / JCM 13017 / BCRC 16820 / KCTC 9966 / NRRL B-24157 / PYR-1) TaxID=350058 RepID=A1T725_MYCVP|nr:MULTISPECIES: hypothetical protein [Mycolicibacterium]ABM12975.1 conserved hypothetical protein [Mycolicibacterium vanbaalenii PYR-1]MCV7125977.1 hypothetical protein [Mycolicibacterium vanbaalenii PYR-1]MDW5614756.1 hypothetical protein [Mycolicibacterium sp. D5.8-2]QZT58953.1 hypothetical protein JN084_10510 [Mycolicibacterium austroafricanum]QZY48212.1 hypothetical protein K5L12_11235 [Mycolicibacterium austroafricanum]
MHTPKARPRWVRGALVGASSAVMTAGAHAAAGAGLPSGGALVLALLLCATVAALFGSLRIEGRGAGWIATTAALGSAQFLGHVALTMTGHHHGELVPGPTMTAVHIGAAVLLGGAIVAVEHLYAVCSSVLCWLRLFARRTPRPVARIRRRASNVVAPRPVLAAGLGMRAPPGAVATA